MWEKQIVNSKQMIFTNILLKHKALESWKLFKQPSKTRLSSWGCVCVKDLSTEFRNVIVILLKPNTPLWKCLSVVLSSSVPLERPGPIFTVQFNDLVL